MRRLFVGLAVLLGVLFLTSLTVVHTRVGNVGQEDADMEEFITDKDEAESAGFSKTDEALPTKYIGVWTGEGIQDNPASKWSILLALTRGSTQSIVGAIAYPSLSCGGELTLRSVKADSIELLEDITYGNCIDRGIITLRVMTDGDFDYSWRNQNGSDTATGSLSKISTAGTAISVQYLGVWRGRGNQTNPSSEWSILLALTNGRMRATVGAIAYPSLSCGGELILQDISAGSIKLFEDITYGTSRCVDSGIVTLKLIASDELKYQWHSPDVTSTATGSLVKIKADLIPKPVPTPAPPSSISGRVIDSNKKPIADVTISDGAGHTVKTGKDGTYRLSELAAGTYTLTPSKQDYTFSPASSQVKVPPDATGVDFRGTATACENALFTIPHAGEMGWPYMDPGQDVIDKDGTIHRGIDIFGKPGDVVYAPYAGKVISESSNFRIRHSSLGVDTYYGHVISTVPKWKEVKRGDPIALLENLDSNTHLHFVITTLDASQGDDGWASELIFANSFDPSPYLNAQLNYFDGARRYQRPVLGWCNNAAIGAIEGRVKLPNGEAVSDAEVRIEGTQEFRWTDFWMGRKEGIYKFSNAPVRKVKITASKGDLKGSVTVTVQKSKIVKAPDLILRR